MEDVFGKAKGGLTVTLRILTVPVAAPVKMAYYHAMEY